MAGLLQYVWPAIVERTRAERMIKQVYIAATVLSVMFFLTGFLGIYSVPGGPDHRLDFIDAALFMILGYCVKGRDPYAAVMLFALCAAEAILRFSFMVLPVWLLLLLMFAHGVRAAFWILRAPPAEDIAESTSEPAAEISKETTPAPRPAFFGLSGRLSRRWYGLYLVQLALMTFVGLGVLYVLFGLSGMNAQATTLLLGLCLLPFLFLAFMLTVQRSHDFDRSGWRALFLLIVPIGLLCFLVVPGSPGKNSYGAPNP